ncbi:hypothetical protein Indivirus_1_24 [Indivirus ILV1]|uniref:Uncharacterized protein n=1 Tax=Indivirus ILV1 TaxID=1977633 RepID=A0A1V0SCH8_9VIRU|nr:hypothetical protein Indivirus_1_24 [Indivirus ILV1]
MSEPNRGVFFGHSSRLIYDAPAYSDRLLESTSPLAYRLNPNQINNCNSCLSTWGPRASHNGVGVSTLVGQTTSPAQDLADLESILTNRNVLASKTKASEVNDIDVTKFKLQHARVCNDFLAPVSTLLTDPTQNFRGMAINRFYDLDRDRQQVIFYDFSRNTSLEARDNYQVHYRAPIEVDHSLPVEIKGMNMPCAFPAYSVCRQ